MLKDVTRDSRGNRLMVEDNTAGGRTYWSDEIGGGVMVWDTCLVSDEMLRLALEHEKALLEGTDGAPLDSEGS